MPRMNHWFTFDVKAARKARLFARLSVLPHVGANVHNLVASLVDMDPHMANFMVSHEEMHAAAYKQFHFRDEMLRTGIDKELYNSILDGAYATPESWAKVGRILVDKQIDAEASEYREVDSEKVYAKLLEDRTLGDYKLGEKK